MNIFVYLNTCIIYTYLNRFYDGFINSMMDAMKDAKLSSMFIMDDMLRNRNSILILNMLLSMVLVLCLTWWKHKQTKDSIFTILACLESM